jgi:hypothetical protein
VSAAHFSAFRAEHGHFAMSRQRFVDKLRGSEQTGKLVEDLSWEVD